MRVFSKQFLTAGVAALALSLGLGVAPAASADDLAVGKAEYAKFCATCHGVTGDGQGPVGKTLNPPPRDFTKGDFKYGGSEKDIFDVISNGAASKGGSPLMAPWGSVIPEDKRKALAKYVLSLKK